MAALGLVLLLLTIAYVVVVIVRWQRMPPPDSVDDPDWLSGYDLAELDQMFARVEAEQPVAKGEALRSRLQPVIVRRAPLRCIRQAPAAGITRLGFADGTTVLVRSQGGALAMLALIATRQPVLLTACEPEHSAARLTFEYGGTRVRALAVAVDQAD